MLAPGPDGLHRPETEAELQELIRSARRNGRELRVRGSGHSVDEAIHTSSREGVDVSLDRLTRIEFDDERRRVTAQAGCRLGADPRDRSGRAPLRAGLCWQIEQRGWALPVTAGVTRQTVAGFAMTGSAGGSRVHALDDQIVALRLVDAEGDVRELTRESDRDLFHAAGVSLGLLGVVTSVTFQCVERFDVEGCEQVVRTESAPFDVFGERGVDDFLERNEYARFFWWPQAGVDRLTIWTAARAASPDGPRRPYLILPEVAGSTQPAQFVAGKVIAAACRRSSFGPVTRAVYNAFLAEAEPQRFRDAWWRTIPMDDELDERWFPTAYTELWFPAENTATVMRRLRDHFASGGYAATGGYAFEVYAAKESRFWMSPGHGRPSTRVNVCWMETNPGDPRRGFFPQFWDLFEDLDYRLHWAKNLFPDGARTARRMRASYARFDDFMRLRDTLDPDGVFLTHYWREHLGIGAPKRRAGAGPAHSNGVPARPAAPPPSMNGTSPTPAAGPPRGRWRWPLFFKLRPSDEAFAARAPFVIDEHAVIDAPAEAIYDAVVDLVGARDWLADFVRAEWISGPDADGNQVVDEIFRFMTQRTRTFRAERGRRWMASIDACTLPLARELMEDLELTPLGDGRTQLRWRFFYEPHPAVKPLRGPVHKVFAKMVADDVKSLGEHVAARHAAAPAAAEPQKLRAEA